MKPGIHYHIHWSSVSSLDWKPFPTREEATKAAVEIKKPTESYVIVERDDECERCKELNSNTPSAVNEGNRDVMPTTRNLQVGNLLVLRSDAMETDEARMLATILLEHHRYLRGHLWLTPDTVQPKHMLPYGELCTRAGLGSSRTELGHFLGQVAYWCQSKGLPPLNSLAVNAQTKKPGDGYYAAAASHLNWWTDVQACIACSKYPQQV